MAGKTPDPTDKHIGARVRTRRMMLGQSQTWLGDQLGLTFQQVQKYEKGTTRIGGSRMQQIATILKVPVGWFYEGLPGANGSLAIQDDFTPAFLADRQGLALARAFMAITNPEMRSAILQIAETAAAKHLARAA